MLNKLNLEAVRNIIDLPSISQSCDEEDVSNKIENIIVSVKTLKDNISQATFLHIRNQKDISRIDALEFSNKTLQNIIHFFTDRKIKISRLVNNEEEDLKPIHKNLLKLKLLCFDLLLEKTTIILEQNKTIETDFLTMSTTPSEDSSDLTETVMTKLQDINKHVENSQSLQFDDEINEAESKLIKKQSKINKLSKTIKEMEVDKEELLKSIENLMRDYEQKIASIELQKIDENKLYQNSVLEKEKENQKHKKANLELGIRHKELTQKLMEFKSIQIRNDLEIQKYQMIQFNTKKLKQLLKEREIESRKHKKILAKEIMILRRKLEEIENINYKEKRNIIETHIEETDNLRKTLERKYYEETGALKQDLIYLKSDAEEKQRQYEICENVLDKICFDGDHYFQSILNTDIDILTQRNQNAKELELIQLSEHTLDGLNESIKEKIKESLDLDNNPLGGHLIVLNNFVNNILKHMAHLASKSNFCMRYDIRIRDEVSLLGKKYGVVLYIGEVDFANGIFYGIGLYSKGMGDHDGQIDGKRYFQCEKLSGTFVRRSEITRILQTTDDSKVILTKPFYKRMCNQLVNQKKDLEEINEKFEMSQIINDSLKEYVYQINDGRNF